MATIDKVRNSIIEKLLAINDKDYLTALHRLVANSRSVSESVKLTEDQKLMLQMSDEDIINGRLISHTDLDNKDREWLKEKQ